jgi:hypothetical protein
MTLRVSVYFAGQETVWLRAMHDEDDFQCFENRIQILRRRRNSASEVRGPRLNGFTRTMC